MPLPTHLECRVVFGETASGAEAGFKLFYVLDTGTAPDVTNINGVANDFKTAFTAALPPVLTAAHQFKRVELVYRSSGGDYVDGQSNTAAVTGGAGSGGVLPEEVAALIQRRTGGAGRHQRGRIFLPYVPAALVTGSTLTTAGVTAYQTVATMVMNTVNSTEGGSDWLPRQPSYKISNLLPVHMARVYTEVVSRKDRRFVRRGATVSAPS